MRRALLLGLCVASVPFLIGAEGPMSNLERGRELFHGELPLTARMVGHTDTLPQQAVRCRNCHSHSQQPALGGDAAQDFAPLLNARTLLSPSPRRGGPASKYEREGLCKLLREGVDPAHVMIQQAMPRYSVSDADCEALWTYLTSP